MVTLVLTQQNGQTWTCYFDTHAQAEAWLAIEQTRPYWSNYTGYEITGEDRVEPQQ